MDKIEVFYIGYLNDEPSGELFWCDTEEALDECAEIIALHSCQKSWGKGLGKAMMDKALQDILESGKKQACLWVFKDNIRARKFYEKCGFQADGIEQVSDFDGAVEVRYTRTIG